MESNIFLDWVPLIHKQLSVTEANVQLVSTFAKISLNRQES